MDDWIADGHALACVIEGIVWHDLLPDDRARRTIRYFDIEVADLVDDWLASDLSFTPRLRQLRRRGHDVLGLFGLWRPDETTGAVDAALTALEALEAERAWRIARIHLAAIHDDTTIPDALDHLGSATKELLHVT